MSIKQIIEAFDQISADFENPQAAQVMNSLKQEVKSLILKKEPRAVGLIEETHVENALNFLKEFGDFTVDYHFKESVYIKVSPNEEDIAERQKQIDFIRRTDHSDTQDFLKIDDPYYKCIEPSERRIFINPPKNETPLPK